MKASLGNYLTVGSMQRTIIKVGWLHYCQNKKKKKNKGINLVHPKDAMAAILVKWIVKSLKPG